MPPKDNIKCMCIGKDMCYFIDTWGAIYAMVGGFENTASHCSGDKNKWFDNSSAFTLQELQEDQQQHDGAPASRVT